MSLNDGFFIELQITECKLGSKVLYYGIMGRFKVCSAKFVIRSRSGRFESSFILSRINLY